METYTWVPGTEPELDKAFDQVREERYQDREHRLWENYSREHFESAVALTIAFNKEGVPEICSSIASRDCWPTGAYRILNRMWKNTNKVTHSVKISAAMVANVHSQIDWLDQFTDCKLYFISRQTDNWMEWVAGKFKSQYNIDFSIAPYKYLTCPNECDDTCWQRVIYTGDEKLLNEWKSK
jgi:hypothetical protein